MSEVDQLSPALELLNNLDVAVTNAEKSFQEFRELPTGERITFFNELIAEFEKNKTIIINTANLESNLPLGRLENEFNRTINQIKLFIAVIKEGSWKDASIDFKKDENNIVITDIRKMNVALGPVAVFGASNFPLAFSVAGGDTISALAAGCPVVVKAHNGHPKTSRLVADIILSAGEKTNMPTGFFSIVFDEGFASAIALVKHSLIKAVGFTGSYTGGKALIDAVNTRKEPIPVFAEMGSLNPVLLLPSELANQTEKWAKAFAGSITQGCGQFCTKPGLFFAIESKEFDSFIDILKFEMSKINVHPMLNEPIRAGFKMRISTEIEKSKLVNHIITAENVDGKSVNSSIAIVSAENFIKNTNLREEFFGPFALIVKCKDSVELLNAVSVLHGQLTGTVIGANSELSSYADVIEVLKNKAGRVLFNGVPTGVEVCYSMQHGGPFPASSSIQFTSVGADAIKRFVRPLCFQAWPQSELPTELRNENTASVFRKINGKLTNDSIVDK
jgi:2,5-dioxopentanoate dehydrogenase